MSKVMKGLESLECRSSLKTIPFDTPFSGEKKQLADYLPNPIAFESGIFFARISCLMMNEE